MKAALNGALNLSILDGWWDEWFDGENGWAIPTADGVEDTDRRDDLEAEGLYNLIENAVAPAYYSRDDRGIPPRWLAMMRHTLSVLGPKVLATRMLKEYVNRLYIPAAQAGRAVELENNAVARELASWKQRIRSAWSQVKVEHVDADGLGDVVNLGSQVMIRAYVSLGALSPDDVDVQVVCGRVDADDRIRQSEHHSMVAGERYDGNRWQYSLPIDLDMNGPFGYTVRVVPRHIGLASHADMGLQVVPPMASMESALPPHSF